MAFRPPFLETPVLSIGCGLAVTQALTALQNSLECLCSSLSPWSWTHGPGGSKEDTVHYRLCLTHGQRL